MIQAPLDLFLDLLPSAVNIIGCFSCIKSNKGSTAVFSVNVEVNFCCQYSNVFIYCLKVISLDDTLVHIWNSGYILPFPSSIVIGVQSVGNSKHISLDTKFMLIWQPCSS